MSLSVSSCYLFILVLGAIAVCMFPLWPPEVRLGIYYLSLAAAGFVGVILALCVGRWQHPVGGEIHQILHLLSLLRSNIPYLKSNNASSLNLQIDLTSNPRTFISPPVLLSEYI